MSLPELDMETLYDHGGEPIVCSLESVRAREKEMIEQLKGIVFYCDAHSEGDLYIRDIKELAEELIEELEKGQK